MADSKTILFVSMPTGDAMRCAKRLGLRIVVVTDTKLTWQVAYVDEQLPVDPYDSRSALDAATSYASRLPVAGVVTLDERAVPTGAIIAEALGLPGNTYEAAYAARNKFVMRTRFLEHGLACPRFGIADTLADAEDLARTRVGYPLVLKPLFGSASQGVVRVNDRTELRRDFALIKGIANSHESFVRNDPYRDFLILEEYLRGREVAVDAVLEDGVAHWVGIFDKPDPLEGPTFEETLYITPSSEPREVQAEIFGEVERGARALGLRTGPLHAEVRLTPGGPFVIELGARAIGGVCGRAHTYCLGLDYYEIILRNALGDALEIPAGDRTPAGVMMLPVPGTGRLVAVHGVEEASRVEGVHDVFILRKPGDILRSFPEQGCYLGFILATGSSNKEVAHILNDSHSLLRFELDRIDDRIDDSAIPAPGV